jgi:hypothetical protein
MIIILISLLLRFSLVLFDYYIFPLPGGEFDAFSFNRVAVEFSNHLESGKTYNDFDYIYGWIYSIFVGYVYFFFGVSSLLGSSLSCLAWFLSALVLRSLMIKLNYEKKKITIALAIYSFLFPTSIIFTSIMLREVYLLLFTNILFLTIINFYYSKYFYQKIYNFILFISISALLCLFHKAGILFIGSFVLFLILFLIFKVGKIKSNNFHLYVFSLLLIFLFEYFGIFEQIFDQIKSYQSGHFEKYEHNRALYYTKSEILSREYSFINLIVVIIKNTLNYYFQPTIFNVSDIKDIPAIFENNIRILSIIFVTGMMFLNFKNKNLFIVLFMMYLLSETVYAQASVNWGTTSRHHVPVMGLLILLFFFPKVKKAQIESNFKK